MEAGLARAEPSRNGERGAQRAKTFPLLVLLLLMLVGLIAGMAVSSDGAITPGMLYQSISKGGMDGLAADFGRLNTGSQLWHGALMGVAGGFVLFALISGQGLRRSSMHLLLLVVITAVAGMLGVAVLCDYGVSMGEFYHAMLRGQLLLHMQDVLAKNGPEVVMRGALYGGLCGAGLHLLAVTSQQHHGQNRPGAPARH